MLDSIYIGMSGLTSFSKGLSNISNNVANLNTPGFKSSELGFADLFYRYQYSGSGNQDGLPYQQGDGVKTGSTSLKFTQGDFRQTGNDLDVAVDGQGFFILVKDGKTFYTRDGQFKIDDSGLLTSTNDGAKVQGLVGGRVSDINITGLRSNSALATTLINFKGSLSTSSTQFEVVNLIAFDSLGVQHQLKLEFTNDTANTPGRWTFKVLDGTTQISSGEVRYQGSGQLLSGFDKHTFSFAPGGGATAANLTLDFTGTSFFSSSASTMQFDTQNGRAAGFLTKTAIDADGFLNLTYSNGQVIKNQQLGLATFNNLGALQSQGNSRFAIFGHTSIALNVPGKQAAGKLKINGIELSNVNLAQEFSDLIIVQRAYQASSQVISAANEMIQQLGEIRGRK